MVRQIVGLLADTIGVALIVLAGWLVHPSIGLAAAGVGVLLINGYLSRRR